MIVSARGLTRTTAVLSGVFSLLLGVAAVFFHSHLAESQAADSLLDLAGALMLAWVVGVAQTPGDERHPMGHTRAEPLGALVIAALAGILALKVGSGAFASLLHESSMKPDVFLLGLFLGKVTFKFVVFRIATGQKGPAFSALRVDARNDILMGAVAAVGFLGARAGAPEVDAWVALPTAIWIGWSGVELARENIDNLLGVAPPPERRREILRLASGVPGVVDAHDLMALSDGSTLSVHVHITVDGTLTVREGHDIAECVRLRLLDEEDVGLCSVHVDPSV